MRSVIAFAIFLGIVGLVVGYFIFAREGGGHYIPLVDLFGKPSTLGGKIGLFVTGLGYDLKSIRQSILASGVVGLVIGLVISIAGRRGRR